VAVVGSGPAGFYAAASLFAADVDVSVDMIERLPTPWGLVRLGVAPDHPEIKAVSRVFEKIAREPGFRFFGNVDVGRDVAHGDLVRLYDAVVYTVGAQADRRLGIPGEHLPGSWPAFELVAWYNGHPDFQQLDFDLSTTRAVVIGNGNVAVDVARMLALTEAELDKTDTTDVAIDAIVGSGIEEIVMLGRRGPVQASFTTPELKELGELSGADVVVDPAELELDPASAAALETDRTAARNLDVLRDFAARKPAGKPKRLSLRFCVSPVAILGEGRVEAIELVRNALAADGSGEVRAVPTEDVEVIPCGLVVRGIGYQGVALPDVPFHEKHGVIPNDGGRVLDTTGRPLPGVYCAGWIKRGPTGVIGTNKKDAAETVEVLLADARAGRLARLDDRDLEQILLEREVEIVEYDGWESIDEHERGLGSERGRPRVKLVTWDELLATARSAVGRRLDSPA
jgi:ferredoxin--NADP+ reductase